MKKCMKKWLALLLSTVFVTSMVAVPAMAADDGVLKVAAISDLHYADTTATDRDGMMLSKSRDIIQAALSQIIQNKANVDVLVVTGGLTADGTKAQHEEVIVMLNIVKAAGIKVYVIPGETDVAKSGVNPNAVTDAQFAELYDGFGYASTTRNPNDLSYVVSPEPGYKLVMLDSVANNAAKAEAYHGQGVVDTTWAKTQYAGSDLVVTASHHPSVSRGGVDATFIGLLYTVAGLKDANGNPYFTGDPFDGITLVDKSYADMSELGAAGMKYVLTGHSHMSNVATGQNVTPATETEPEVVTASWTDYNVGSLVDASASIRYVTFDKAAATEEAKAVSTVDFLTTVEYVTTGDQTLYDVAFATVEANVPALVDDLIAQFMPVYSRMMQILKVVANGFADNLSIGEGLIGAVGNGPVRTGVKNTIADVFAILEDTSYAGYIIPAIDEIKTAFMATTVDGYTMQHVLADVITQLQVDNQQVAPSLRPMVNELKSDPAVNTKAAAAVADFAGKLNGTKTVALLNKVLDQQLTLKILLATSSHTLRELLAGPVQYKMSLVSKTTVNLWDILDSLQPYMPDGETPVPAEDKPSAVARPLVNALALGADNAATPIQSVARFKTNLASNAGAVVDLALRFDLISWLQFLLQNGNIVIPVIPPTEPEQPEGNLLENNGFEAGLDGWTAVNADSLLIAPTAISSRTGTGAVMMEGNQTALHNYLKQERAISLSGVYTFTVYVRAATAFSGEGVTLSVTAQDSAGLSVKTAVSTPFSALTNDWQAVSVSLSVPATAKKLVVKIGGVNSTGSFLVDDASLERVSSLPPAGNLLLNAGFESGLTSWTPVGSAAASSSAQVLEGGKSVSLTYSVSGEPASYLSQTYHTSFQGTYTFSASIKTVTPLQGIGAALFIEAKDAQGNVLASAASRSLADTAGAWQALSVNLDAPAGTAEITVKIAGLYCTGTFYADAASLTLQVSTE